MDAQQAKMKILFLDIDFVLNSHKFEIEEAHSDRPYRPYYSEIDPKALAVLIKILETDSSLQIVIHSSWRDEISLNDFKKIFSSFDFPIERIQETTKPLIDKAQSIELWIKEHPFVTQFVILDDDGLFGLRHPLYSRFYRVPTRGLNSSDISEILKKI